ncbi:hypothetical protein ElyMa_001424100 [Elysia marginata]|uniref:Uncharacterized protein n=1 Tax=Elysia marginata TaxID=1093978 RepID=A0AAV4IZ36_9GAST|nr:hypothetical protein ElyMa_001424100 [Elysia marginata]
MCPASVCDCRTALDVHGKLRIRLRPDLTENDTWVGIIENPRNTSDDDIGALYYVVAVIFIYGLSIVMMIASHIRKNKQDSQLRTYLKEMSNLRKTERREKVLHKMTDLAKREKEKAEREAESKRRLQEKLRLTGSGGESGDDTESDVPTSATPSSQARQQRRPLLAGRKPTFGSTSPLGSVVAIPIKDEDEDETAEGGSDVPSGNESSEVYRGKSSHYSGGDGGLGHDGRGNANRAESCGSGGRREMRLSPSSCHYSLSAAISPPIRSAGRLVAALRQASLTFGYLPCVDGQPELLPSTKIEHWVEVKRLTDLQQ